VRLSALVVGTLLIVTSLSAKRGDSVGAPRFEVASTTPRTPQGRTASAQALDPDVPDVRPELIGAHMRFLADDLLEGRGTGTREFPLAARYVERCTGRVDQFSTVSPWKRLKSW
jgi:hypothetical protein